MPPVRETTPDTVPAPVPCPATTRPGLLRGLWPGLALAGGVAALALALRTLPGVAVLSPMILAIVIGIAVRNLVGTPAAAQPGLGFAMRRVLRFAIVLLGLQLTAADIVELGWSSAAVLVATLTATFLFTEWLGRRLGVEPGLARLVAAGTSICGASAVVAANTATRASDEDVAYAVACVTLFGSLAMVLYPLLPELLHLGPRAYGLWAGASIHEIAQVVAAAFQAGGEAGHVGTIAKLSRVMMLAPVVLLLGVWTTRAAAASGRAEQGATEQGGARARPPVPWFVFGFLALCGLNSVIAVDPDVRGWIVLATTVLLTVALAAMGLETDIRKLAAKGLRPLLLGAAATAFIAVFSLGLVEILG
ncbi:YeiH family protein [Rhodoplanes sp. TEM]|uniref:YeiH family protein n=1 Tax=Rhodoplanes tepidamans TaxID=200616 RepID=A0ABT5JA54_RHOTP|nr:MULTISPECIES: YeiH family protein [Rhodoplanes]MDC7786443.1 YeiH family protein [Rhodoplanes tepidamans]MDC7985085.1 YeiH family protein [Rhodoplanes sp. TEM]MDQ0357328.1 putative integral membrane protein (TIGR00698 family) [Rhodoplanes tepidamans]